MPKIHVETEVNGEPTEFLCEGHESLLDALRNELGLTGTKEGCTTGDCVIPPKVGAISSIVRMISSGS